MERIQRSLFALIADIAEETYAKGSSMAAERLMERLEGGGWFFPGSREIVARQLVSAALHEAEVLDDAALCEAVSSTFTDENGWPLLMRKEA